MSVRSKLTTWLSPATSIPRAATSVAISACKSPPRKLRNTFCRNVWRISPCSASTAKPRTDKNFASASARRLVRTKISACPVVWSRRISQSLSRFSPSASKVTCCVTLSAVMPDCGALTRAGSRRNCWPSASISGGMVAENNMV